MATTEEPSETSDAKVENKPESEEPSSFIGSGSTEYTLDPSSSVDELNKGILGLLEPAVEEVNSRVNDVRSVTEYISKRALIFYKAHVQNNSTRDWFYRLYIHVTTFSCIFQEKSE